MKGPAAWLLLLAGAVGTAAAAAMQPPASSEPVAPAPSPAPPVPTTPAAAVPPAEPSPGPGPMVLAVEIRSDSPLPRDEQVSAVIEIHPGEPLADVAVRRTLRNLVATGLGSDVALYTREEPGGVVAVVVLRPVPQVVDVQVAGRLGLSATDLKSVVPQRPAQPLAEESVVAGVYNLQDLYRRNGYFKASVRVRVEQRPARQAVVTYQVDSGERAAIGAVAFDGKIAPFTDAALIAHLRAKPGRPFQERLAEDDAERLQGWLVQQQHGAARVEKPRQEFDAAANRVKLTFPIDVGPVIKLAIQGADVKKLKKKGLLPFLGAAGYDEALVQQALTRLRTYYQQQGHYQVKVDSREARVEGQLELTISVDPGPVFTLEAVQFSGNRAFSSARLATLLATSPRSLLHPGSGRLVQETLDEDLDNVRSYYALQGFAAAKVGPPQITARGQVLRLRVPVEEGPQQRLVKLELQGVEKLDAAKLRQALPLKESGPFHPVLLEQTLTAIRSAYGEAGYTQAQVSAAEDWNAPHTLVDLTIKVLEGPRRLVDQVIVRGNQATKTDIIRRTLRIQHGDPIGQSSPYQLESNLYRLGIFSRVDIDLTGSPLDTERDVLVRVEEGKFKSLRYGVGYDSEEKVRGLLGFSDNNIGGEADSLRADLRLSSLDKRFSLLFNQPFLGPYPVPLNSTLFYFDTQEVSFRTRRWGARSEAVKTLSHTRYSLALDYRVVRLQVDPGVALNSIERQNRPVQVTSVIPAVLIDHRDDPLVPTRGWSSLAQVQYSFPAIGGKADFVKLFLQQTRYVNLGRPGVLAASLRVGGIEAFSTLPTGDPGVPPSLPQSNVFIDERFFGGGGTTDRAYSLDQLGIRGRTLIQPGPGSHFMPVGGNGLVLANFDYRFPIVGALGGTLFFDTGNVWADWRDIRLTGTEGFKSGAGFGFRYLSPIGPLRAELGWKLHRERNPPEGPIVFFLSFGNPF
ncbi:MAG TPA: outer membrane protein assembly factor BamA [Thermoanaerobaculia bacterium]|nr:outer membrane protein assembly factor BamA [Thermoanaerobaculia bacterium]